MARASRQDEANQVAALARRLGLPAERPRLLKAAHHTSFLLAQAGLVARVLSGEATEWAMARAERELAVVRALHHRGRRWRHRPIRGWRARTGWARWW